MRRIQQNKIWFRKNELIRADNLRVIGPDGKQIGILTRAEALAAANEAELDLVEIAPNANPPVARIIDYTKFLYEEEKKARQERKKQKKGKQMKEIWLTPFMAENDYETRLERVREFLADSAKVRVTIRPKRRLPNVQPLFVMMRKALENLSEISRIEQEPKLLGRQLVAIISPAAAKAMADEEGEKVDQVKEHEETQNETKNEEISQPPVQSDGDGQNSSQN
ncbi:translation initiation factor IF-3 [Candidatus Microgenomates bacterium]|nr:translation initiation factor IF-3 [Candidatus Microgenomates bacterium]